eukprot:gene32163-41698_t
MSHQFPPVNSARIDSTLQNTGIRAKSVAERVLWMARTSDVYGSYEKTDLESYLTLLRRKVQEKCNTVFKVFDSDHPNTMFMDEFASWVMNSEFKPRMSGNPPPYDPESPAQHLRRKFLTCVRENAKAFENLDKQVSFIEFISFINLKNMKLTDKEARNVFQIVDHGDSGYISKVALLQWADTGRDDYSNKVDRPPAIQADSVGELCSKVVGRNTKALESAFSHVQRGSGTRLSFEEFRRCLLNAGAGKNIYDVQQLFQALGGATNGSADIDLFFKHLSPIIVDPRTEVSNKPELLPIVSIGRADRHLRDAIRKSYKIVKQEIKANDPTGSGYIESDALYAILVKKCIPLTFQDFRFLTQQLKKGPGGIDYNHFLQAYNPTHAHHELDGATLSHSSSLLTNRTIQSQLVNFADDVSMATSAFDSELKQVWHVVLKECHRADPERNGQVSRATFISALQKADTGKTLSLDSVNKLADDYILPNGMVNYLYCFRNYAGDITGMGSSTGTAGGTPSVKLSRIQASRQRQKPTGL